MLENFEDLEESHDALFPNFLKNAVIAALIKNKNKKGMVFPPQLINLVIIKAN